MEQLIYGSMDWCFYKNLTTYKLHSLLGIIFIAVRDEGVTPILPRERVHH